MRNKVRSPLFFRGDQCNKDVGRFRYNLGRFERLAA